MDLFSLVSWSLVTIAVVTLIWPVNILLMALACKVRQGTQPIPLEGGELAWRCTFATLGLAGFTLVLLGLVYFLVEVAEMPPGPVQLAVLMLYVPAGVGFLFWILALEDLLQALSVFLLYMLLPGLPLLLIGHLTHSWDSLRQAAPWLLVSTT